MSGVSCKRNNEREDQWKGVQCRDSGKTRREHSHRKEGDGDGSTGEEDRMNT